MIVKDSGKSNEVSLAKAFDNNWYQANYSCASSLLNVIDDINRTHDEGKFSILLLLSFFKAFNLSDYSI